MIMLFFFGFIFGILFIISLGFLFFFNCFDGKNASGSFTTQITASRARIPMELKAFLSSSSSGNGSEWESCLSLSLLLHFIFQEIKDTRNFRRWVYKKLQLELNDTTARSSTAGRIIQDIQIRDLDVGMDTPLVRNVRVSEFKFCESDPDMFDELVLLLDLDYRGGFQMSVDALMAFGKFARLSVKMLELKGRARLTIKRQPFAHWSFCFIENPQMNLKIDSQFQGRNLRHLIPLIGTAFRKVLQLKHVWPNYKIRFRPFFQNPLFFPSPNIEALRHIRLAGSGLEVTVLNASKLNISFQHTLKKLFCKVFLGRRQFGGYPSNRTDDKGNISQLDSQMVSLILSLSRNSAQEDHGLVLEMKNGKDVRVERVRTNSCADRSGFHVGDILVAVNNIPVRNDRQTCRLLTVTSGDLLILVERELGLFDHDVSPLNTRMDSDSLSNFTDFDFHCAQPIEFSAKDETESDIMNQIDAEKGTNSICPLNKKESVYEIAGHRFVENNNEEIISQSNLTRKSRLRRSRSESSLSHFKVPVRKFESCNETENTNSIGGRPPMIQKIDVSETVSKSTQDENTSVKRPDRLKISSKRERLHAKAIEMARHWQSGRTRINELLWNKRKPTELAVEANDENVPIEIGAEELPPTTRGMTFLEKPKENSNLRNRKIRYFSKSPSQSSTINKSATEERSGKFESTTVSSDEILMRTTKLVSLSKDPLWGQSLHFSLKNESLYMNVLVFVGEEEHEEECELLGYTSIYVPRIVEDCMLTLSNSHRERFHLKGPKEKEESPAVEFEELSRHNGFDPRLCFGDIVLGFRLFPEGLPAGLETVNDTH